MVLDSSALVAIFQREPGFEVLLQKVERAGAVLIGAPTVAESVIVLSRRQGQDARPSLYALLRFLDAEIVPFEARHLDVAASAFLRFGRGRHPAALNYGDCMAYAVAAVEGMPLLFIGEDFPLTDIEAA
jgi:ribonuclease VapC